MRSSATSAERNISFSIEQHCPQCGAPVLLDEADRFFVCEFCRVRSCIAQKGFGRYYFAPHKDIPEETPITYLPYWRFKGVEYTCTPQGVDHRFLDISWLALPEPPTELPYSLGFRSQALALKRVSGKTPGTFLRPLGFKESFPHGRDRITAGQPGFREDIGETFSLIFSPVYPRDGQIMDGVLNRSLSGEWPMIERDPCKPGKETRILSGLCPGCGWDLEGQSDSLVLVCRNCHSLWQPRQDRLDRVRFASAAPEDPDQVLVPFWKIDARIQGMAMDTMGDLTALANLPGRPAQATAPISFWAPAFKIRPKVFLRISRQLTLGQPAPALDKTIRKQEYLPITLPAQEAVQSIRVTLASLARPLKERFFDINGAGLTPLSATLIFLPFDPMPHEYLHPGLNLAINRNMLHLSGNL